MKPRKFHIWDFPEDKVRVLFKSHKKFIDHAIASFGSQKALADFLGISYSNIYGWKKYPLYIPLKYVKKVVNKLQLNWLEIEKDITSYKGVNTSSPIFNAKLPIRETPEIFTLITHIICDGSVNKNGIPAYVNSNRALIDNLDRILENNFGEMNAKLYFGIGTYKDCYEYRFPKIIVELINSFYNVQFGSIGAYLPEELFSLPKEFALDSIKAVIDDEGCIRDRGIVISMKNKRLVEQIRKLIILAFDHGAVNFPHKKDSCWYIVIKPKALEEFENKITLNHSEKRKTLERIINKIENDSLSKKNSFDLKLNILEDVKDKEMATIDDLMDKLPINCSNINLNLKKMHNEGLVVKSKLKYENIWSLTERGKDFLKKWSIKDKLNKRKSGHVNFDLPDDNFRVGLTNYGRERIFYLLQRIFKNQDEIASFLKVHRNTICNWQKGRTKMPLIKLRVILNLFVEDISKEILKNIETVRFLNNKYPTSLGDNKDVSNIRGFAFA